MDLMNDEERQRFLLQGSHLFLLTIKEKKWKKS